MMDVMVVMIINNNIKIIMHWLSLIRHQSGEQQTQLEGIRENFLIKGTGVGGGHEERVGFSRLRRGQPHAGRGNSLQRREDWRDRYLSAAVLLQ